MNRNTDAKPFPPTDLNRIARMGGWMIAFLVAATIAAAAPRLAAIFDSPAASTPSTTGTTTR